MLHYCIMARFGLNRVNIENSSIRAAGIEDLMRID